MGPDQRTAGRMIVDAENKLEECRAERDDLREKLIAANTRVSELFNELGIVQNEAATQRGELERQVAEANLHGPCIGEEEFTKRLEIVESQRRELQAEVTTLRKITLTDEACELLGSEIAREIKTHSTCVSDECDFERIVRDAIRDARGKG